MAELEREARKHTELALNTLVQICGNEDCPAASRVSAAKEILDRGWGKAKQTVDLNGMVNVGQLDNQELDETIRRELAAFLISGNDGNAAEEGAEFLN
jgi:hypothetical protein